MHFFFFFQQITFLHLSLSLFLILCHLNPLHVLLQYIHEPALLSSSIPSVWELHLQDPCAEAGLWMYWTSNILIFNLVLSLPLILSQFCHLQLIRLSFFIFLLPHITTSLTTNGLANGLFHYFYQLPLTLILTHSTCLTHVCVLFRFYWLWFHGTPLPLQTITTDNNAVCEHHGPQRLLPNLFYQPVSQNYLITCPNGDQIRILCS